MRCYEGHGGLSDLFQLDQPVILRLTTESEKFYSVALTALDHQTATLKLADSTQRISLKDLANTWHGQYVAIWTPPPNSNGDRFMKRRSSIAWLRHVMQTIDGIGDTGSGVFDDDLSKRIRAFQLSEGIQPDGLVGPLTVIHLNVRSGKPGPHLVTDKRG
jgi:general secretion pathway protein A